MYNKPADPRELYNAKDEARDVGYRPVYGDWVRAVAERDAERTPRRAKSRTGY